MYVSVINRWQLNMVLNKNQFEVLSTIAQNENLSQRELTRCTNLSLGTINKCLRELKEFGVVSKDNEITKKGTDYLENFKVKRAIFMAAGFGSRMVPVTLNTPKPLVRVRGKRIIDGLIDACLKADIKEIYIVRGYLAEQFDQLLVKYPMIKFIENPLYNDSNNIFSVLLAKELLSNAYVFEADLLIYNDKIISKYHYSSDFLGIYKERTDDWCLETRNNIIIDEKIGGVNCYQMVGISYWNKEDGIKLAKDIVEVFEMPGGRERYWEQVPLVFKKENYKVEVKECAEGDIVEIDSFSELKAIDSSYNI